MRMESSADWYDDPLERFEKRYHDGLRWTDRVSSSGVPTTDPEPIPPSIAAPSRVTAGDATQPADLRRRRMGVVAVGCGVAMVLGMFLPWATSWSASLTGVGWRLGFVTGLCGALIGLYGAQAVRPGAVRYHPGALAAIVIATLVCLIAFIALDEVNKETLGLGNIDPGSGLDLTTLAALVAIWPLVVLWGDHRRRGKQASHD